jgi:S1-C subfamily serine protease
MQAQLETLSNEIAGLVEKFQTDVVAVHARRHYASSGVHWGPGIIVTAAHAIRRDSDIQVTLADGKRTAAKLAGYDAGTDIAVLKVEGLGSPGEKRTSDAASAKAGELALVLGRSPDSGPNASLGVISAVSGRWRTWRGGHLDQYIRLDATLFPNSSGGAVIDCRGQILGIATSALSRIAGLAIPESSINRVLDSVLEKGYVPRGYLGVGIQPVAIPEAQRTALSIPNEAGLIVLSLHPKGPADQAGVLLGDILLSVDAQEIESVEDLHSFSDSGTIGKAVRAGILRAGNVIEVTITVGERPGQR